MTVEEPAYFRRLRRVVAVLAARHAKHGKTLESVIYRRALRWLDGEPQNADGGRFSIVTTHEGGRWAHVLVYQTPTVKIPNVLAVVDVRGRRV